MRCALHPPFPLASVPRRQQMKANRKQVTMNIPDIIKEAKKKRLSIDWVQREDQDYDTKRHHVSGAL
jgi:hypothetical protein